MGSCHEWAGGEARKDKQGSGAGIPEVKMMSLF